MGLTLLRIKRAAAQKPKSKSRRHMLDLPESISMGEGPSEEEVKRNLELDQASDYLEKGQYESSLLLLKKLGQCSSGYKDVAELVAIAEVCFAAATRLCNCIKPHQSKSLDWYLVLKVEENADIDVIRRRYHQLALLLHPDKNKHSKAEDAFKLVSEAYRCLSDKNKRALFNADRSKAACKICLQKSQKLDGNCMSSLFGKSQPGQTHSTSWRESVDSDSDNPKKKSDDEKLQMFHERGRARVDSLAQAWKERRAKLKQELQVMNSKSWSDRVDRKEWPTLETSECDSLSCFHRRVQVDKDASSGIPIFYDSDDRFPQYTQARNVLRSGARIHFMGEEPETPKYRETTGRFAWHNHDRQIPCCEPKRNYIAKNLKEILRNRSAFGREPSKASKNLEGLLQKLRAESRIHSQYHVSDMWRGNKMADNEHLTGFYNKYAETSKPDIEENGSLDWYSDFFKDGSLPYSVEDEYRNLSRKQLAQDSKLNAPRNTYCNAEAHCSISECTGNARRSKELLKTLEHLKVEANSVAASLEKLKQGVVG